MCRENTNCYGQYYEFSAIVNGISTVVATAYVHNDKDQIYLEAIPDNNFQFVSVSVNSRSGSYSNAQPLSSTLAQLYALRSSSDFCGSIAVLDIQFEVEEINTDGHRYSTYTTPVISINYTICCDTEAQCQCACACTHTPDYWKNTPLPDSGTLCQLSYQVILQTPPNNRVWYILAQQYISVIENRASGVNTTIISSTLSQALQYLLQCDLSLTVQNPSDNYVGNGDNKDHASPSPSPSPSSPQVQNYLNLVSTLLGFNYGLLGPGRCIDDIIGQYCPCLCLDTGDLVYLNLSPAKQITTTISPESSGNDNRKRRSVTQFNKIEYASITITQAVNVTGFVATPDGIFPITRNQIVTFPQPKGKITVHLSGVGKALIKYEESGQSEYEHIRSYSNDVVAETEDRNEEEFVQNLTPEREKSHEMSMMNFLMSVIVLLVVLVVVLSILVVKLYHQSISKSVEQS